MLRLVRPLLLLLRRTGFSDRDVRREGLRALTGVPADSQTCLSGRAQSRARLAAGLYRWGRVRVGLVPDGAKVARMRLS